MENAFYLEIYAAGELNYLYHQYNDREVSVLFNTHYIRSHFMKRILIFDIFLILIYSSISYAAFDDMGIGARPMGMGGAFVAVADDANAPLHNPAGLGYIENAAAGFTHVMLFSNLVRYEYAGVVVPLSVAGTLGASFGMLTEKSDIYSEKSIALSYSKNLAGVLSLGANLKMLNNGFSSSNPQVSGNPFFDNKTSISAFTMDIGLLAKPVKGLSLGLFGENLVPVNISLSQDGDEKVPMNLRFGLAYNLSGISASLQQPALKETLSTTILSVESSMRKEMEVNAIKLRAGLESWFANQTIALRAGYRTKKVDETSSAATIGASIKIPVTGANIQIDYALQVFGGDIQDKLSHRASLSVSL